MLSVNGLNLMATGIASADPWPSHVCYRLMVVICMLIRVSKEISSVAVSKSYWLIAALYVADTIYIDSAFLYMSQKSNMWFV